ncbi:MAG: ATP-binding protein [Candidatus Diapherotrites archaeon]
MAKKDAEAKAEAAEGAEEGVPAAADVNETPALENERVRHEKASGTDFFDEMLGAESSGKKAKDAAEEPVIDTAVAEAEEVAEGAEKEAEIKEDAKPVKAAKKPKARKRGKRAKKNPDKENGTVEIGKDEKDTEEQEPEAEEGPDGEDEQEDVPEEEEGGGKKEDGTEEDEGGDEKGEEEIEEQMKERAERRELIKETIMKKAVDAGNRDLTPEQIGGVRLSFLEDREQNNVFIGMKKGVWKNYGYDGALQIGKIGEFEYKNSDVFLDSQNPHVVFVCGARGSGKSYVMGVIAEELARKNKNVGVLVVDPVGVFWSMKFPNKEEREIKKLFEWGMKPEGLDNVKVFIPSGMVNEVPKSTYDAGFSMQPSLLTADDWCLTFGVERFSPSGLLLDKVLRKVEKGYRKLETNKEVKGRGKKYSLDEVVQCLQYDAELNSREKGYKQDSIRALISRFEASKTWGIFDEKGTPLSELSRAGQLTVLDTSFLEDVVTALVIGILARRLLAARKISTRKEAAQKFKKLDVDELLELEVPPTWLFIDEAHTLIPSGNYKTPATAGLIEYVKQGRRPGCSLVFATQQPSAIDTRVLSQLDVIMSHKLVFDDDIKAIHRRTPTIIPGQYKKPTFIKSLPVGTALTGDRSETTSRAFIMKIRPRMSQHEGRDAETSQSGEAGLTEKQVLSLALEMISLDLEKQGRLDRETIEQVVRTLNAKYRTNLKPDALMKGLEKAGFVVSNLGAEIKGYIEDADDEPEEEDEEGDEEEGGDREDEEEDKDEGEEDKEEAMTHEEVELLALPQRLDKEKAWKVLDTVRKKKFLGFLGSEENVKDAEMKYVTVWKVKYDVFTKGGEFLTREAFIDSRSGEFLHFDKGRFVQSSGLGEIFGMERNDVALLNELKRGKRDVKELAGLLELGDLKIKRMLARLEERGLVAQEKDKKGAISFLLMKKFDLPPNERHEKLGSLNKLPFVKAEVLSKEREAFTREQVPQVMNKLWSNIMVKKIEELYRPVWFATLEMKGRERKVAVDAVTGDVI